MKIKVSFIGCPASGKTTVAAMFFAQLKDMGISNIEFVPEQARLYIAKKRKMQRLKPEDKTILTYEDQIKIMLNQIEIEEIMEHSLGNEYIIITDSSPINSLFYMDEETRDCNFVSGLIKKVRDSIDILFYCPPLPDCYKQDSHRIHNLEEALAIDNLIPNVLNKYFCQPTKKMLHFNINDSAKQRLAYLTKMVSDRMLKSIDETDETVH